MEADESPDEACLRELEEETGLKGKIRNLIGVYTHKTREYGCLIIIGYEVKVFRSLFVLSSEVKDAKFFSKGDLPSIPFLSHRKIIKEAFNNK